MSIVDYRKNDSRIVNDGERRKNGPWIKSLLEKLAKKKKEAFYEAE